MSRDFGVNVASWQVRIKDLIESYTSGKVKKRPEGLMQKRFGIRLKCNHKHLAWRFFLLFYEIRRTLFNPFMLYKKTRSPYNKRMSVFLVSPLSSLHTPGYCPWSRQF